MIFVCKVASLQEMNEKWEYEIARHKKVKGNRIVWKQSNIKWYKQGYIIPYYGILDGDIICEATAMVHPNVVQNSTGLVDGHTVYLSVFRMIDKFQGKGYFSELFHFMLDDLRNMGYTKATVGAEPTEKKNKEIYVHYGLPNILNPVNLTRI